MNIEERIDPEYADGLAARPVNDLRDIPAARRTFLARFDPAPARPGVRSSYHVTTSYDDAEVRLRVFQPVDPEPQAPCLYWIAGGGYVLPNPDFDEQWCTDRVERHGCTVVSVEWRRAPEHCFPAAAEDIYAGLRWTFAHTESLGINPSRVAVGGMSSGGGSAAALALLVRDRGEMSICHQLLVYPMLDDTNTMPSTYRVTDDRLWHRDANELAWRAYLGDMYGTDDVSPYAAPARMKDLTNLAPATILTGELDLFVDENIVYAQRLMAAGVPVELHVYARVTHGFQRMNPTAGTTLQFFVDLDRALERAF